VVAVLESAIKSDAGRLPSAGVAVADFRICHTELDVSAGDLVSARFEMIEQ